MASFDTWESYFYPDSQDADGIGTLRNKFGERDFFTLRRLEYAVTAVRESELEADLVPIERTYGVDHLRAIHRHLFQDVYEWAGDFRTVNMSKPGGVGFARVRNGEAQQMMDAVQEYVAGEDWSRFDRHQFVKNAAVVFSFVNQCHPFREGNGRASKVFMHHVAELSSFKLDFSRIDADAWNAASALSSPTAERSHIDPLPLVPIFSSATIDRVAAPQLPANEPSRDLRSASYPRSPIEAAKYAGSSVAPQRYRPVAARELSPPSSER